jgi:aerobic-type carbon monoxide dehydrogenase small subunit (CoxS/CutS family)
MADLIQFTLNGNPQAVAVEPADKIIDVLREHLNLTGTKRGCDDGTCGACTVVIDGDAKRACLLPAAKLAGATVLTIEGISQGMEIHPIQKALIEAGAVQCGYCIPGIVLELYALYTKNVDATDDEIKTALSRHFCRCTGYEAIWEGAKLAQKMLQAKS